MNNLKNSLLNKRLPPFSSLIILMLSLTTIFWLSRNLVLFGSKAAAGNTPRNVEISNISDVSFTVSYTTDDKVPGSISYTSEASASGVILDDRDKQSATANPHRVHHITVANLEPEKKYSFSIVSGDERFNNGDRPYEVTTAPELTQEPANEYQVIGKVALDNGSIPTEALLYISSETSQLFSVPVNIDGSFLLPLNTLLTQDLSSFDTLSANTVLKMKVTSGTQTSNISLLANQTNPVPAILLSKDYDFTISESPLSPTLTASESAVPTAPLTGLPISIDTTIASSPSILVPSEDFRFKDRQPTFKGKALPNATVNITIQSEQEITASVQADSNSNWEFKPTVPLDLGNHTITIASPDSQGITQTIAKTFSILADGSQFLEPSVKPVTLTPTPGPTDVPTVTPTPTTNLTPTIDPNSLITPTIAATKAPIAQPGSPIVVALGFFGMLTLIAGGILLFLL